MRDVIKKILREEVSNKRNQLNEQVVKSLSNKAKTLLNKIAIKKGKKQASDVTKSDLSAAVPSTSLMKYLNQLKTVVDPLYNLAMFGQQEVQAACKQSAQQIGVLGLIQGKTDYEPGSKVFTSDKFMIPKIKSSLEGIKDLTERMRYDMKKDLEKSGMLEGDFTIDDAIELLYYKYENEKGALTKVAQAIISVVGGFVIDGRVWRILQEQIRKEYPNTGRLLNSVLSDFIGGIAYIKPDHGVKACEAYFSGIQDQIKFLSNAFGDQNAPNGGYNEFWYDTDINWNLEIDCDQRCRIIRNPNPLDKTEIEDRKINKGKNVKRDWKRDTV